jgi:8-oxo-dGTP pyrophosphatase MutT (NUDIX family)
MPTTTKVRHTARALIINPHDEVLLLSVQLPWLDGPTWTMPGGGIEAGESAEICARREIQEETGYRHVGELVPAWQADIEFRFEDKHFAVFEQYFVARVDHRFKPSMAAMLDYEKDFSLELRWLGFEDLMDKKQHFSPRQIPEMVRHIKEDRLPDPPKVLSDPMPGNYRSP